MIEILASGLIVGAAYATLGLAITLVSKMSGVVNFAQSSVALLGCYTGLVAAQVWDLDPLGGLVIGLLVGAATGMVFGSVIALWFKSADLRVRSSATIALMIGGLTVGARVFGDTPRAAPALVSGSGVTLGGVQINAALLLALATAICLAVVLDAYINRTHGGTRLQAFAERPVTAELIGIPATKMTLGIWGLAGAISALALMVVMSSTARNANYMSLSLLIIPALCAALMGRFKSFYLTLGGGLSLGVFEAFVLSVPDIAPYSQATYLPVVLTVLLWNNRNEVWDGQRA